MRHARSLSNTATNVQAIVNPPTSFRPAVWKYYGFPTEDGTADKTKTLCKICSATFKYCAGSTSSMSALLKRQHSINGKSEVLGSKTVKNSPGMTNSTGTGQLKIQDVVKNRLLQATRTYTKPSDRVRFKNANYAIFSGQIVRLERPIMR